MNVYSLPGTGQEKLIHNFHTCFILEFRYQIGFFFSFIRAIGRTKVWFVYCLHYFSLCGFTVLCYLSGQSYDSKFLKIYPELQPTPLQLEEDLEQLKVLENGYKMKVLKFDHSFFFTGLFISHSLLPWRFFRCWESFRKWNHFILF